VTLQILFGALYGPLICRTLTASVYHTVESVFQGTSSVKALCPGQDLKFNMQDLWLIKTCIHIHNGASGSLIGNLNLMYRSRT
jgi:hypothetical protein